MLNRRVICAASIRLIVHKTAGSLLLCYVDHHDKAYQWAERRMLETHPTTGAAQLVEIRERVQEISIPKYVETAKPAPKTLFAKYSDEQLLAYGVPPEWLGDVRVADEDSLLELVDHLPGEAAEALLELATGGTPVVPRPIEKFEEPRTHSFCSRRYLVVDRHPWRPEAGLRHPGKSHLCGSTDLEPQRLG
ncbi:hypothetical protein GCM10027084_22850 [Pseudoxanthomonas sangjuensis]|uniref:hypothetical protein n=1 Tax=Pseudoxanthomonas sangjuensis TaxID=1503750 RepID=UPI001FE42983|nr:hypothetical protein [Pseudoxanthomonas sangjuensis]